MLFPAFASCKISRILQISFLSPKVFVTTYYLPIIRAYHEELFYYVEAAYLCSANLVSSAFTLICFLFPFCSRYRSILSFSHSLVCFFLLQVQCVYFMFVLSHHTTLNLLLSVILCCLLMILRTSTFTSYRFGVFISCLYCHIILHSIWSCQLFPLLLAYDI